MNGGIDIRTGAQRKWRLETYGDKIIWAAVLILSLWSMLVVYSSTGTLAYKMSTSTESYLIKQVGYILIGLMGIYLLHRLNYKHYSKAALWLFWASVPLLLYTLFFGSRINDASRWIKLPIVNMTFQTSDMAKLALFMFLSRQLSRKQSVIHDLRKGYLQLLWPVALVCLLIAPANLSTALLVGASCMMLMFIGRARFTHILLTIMVLAIPLGILVAIASAYRSAPGEEQVELPVSLQKGRVETWVRRIQEFMYAESQDASYQVQQAKIAIAKGGWIGMGPGNSQARNFLPHPYSDFIFAITIEEYGLAGGAVLTFLYLLFLFRCIRIFRRCPYAFGAFLSMGLGFTLAVQAMVNMAVNVNILPVTGVTLPLMSMGGTSIFFTCCAIGIILSVSRHVEQEEGLAASGKTTEHGGA
ncbi:MAG: FtsW/RodA/SpoVE family cell cycle protein [bacterium]|jgi:cell division protein FtsW|nr:FtsW/RodA/SpoVE family cell cycle protein [Chitinophagaceae bacterium]